MKTHLISLLAIVFLVVSCNNSNHVNSDLPYQVNLERDIKNISSVPLSTLGSKLEYIPLETDSASLIKSISNTFVTDSFIFVNDYNRLMLFNRSGKYIRQIGSVGRGPGQYSSVGDFIIDQNNREIYILSSRVVLVYDFNGRFKRDFKTDFPCRQFIQNDSGELVFHPFNMPASSAEPVYSWYIMDNRGNIQTKIANTLKRMNRGLVVPTSPLYMHNGNLYFMEFGVDTLYNYVNHIKKPYAVFNAGRLKFPPDPTMAEVPNINGKIWISDARETKKSLFVKVWWDLSDSISNCVFDKSSSKFSLLKDNGFTNDIDGGMTFWPEKIIDDNFMVDFADAFDLIKYAKDKNLKDNKGQSGQLENVVKNLTETSNPVIIILKNK
jgi:hypothetical protein